MANQERSSLHPCIFSLTCHLVLTMKYRRKVITKERLDRLQEIFDVTLEKWNCKMIEFTGESDHVHVPLSAAPNIQLSVLVNNLKTVSSRLIRRDFKQIINKVYWKPVFWHRSYCIVTAGGAPLEIIKRYIENQNTPE
jgi:putative transposase